MKSWISLFILLLVACATSQAQQRIGLGESANGKLDTGSQTMEDGRYYDLYRYDSPGNETILLRLISDDFDAYLMVGILKDGTFMVMDENDDGPEDTNSLLEVRLQDEGTYYVRASSLDAGETGDYTLSLTPSFRMSPEIDISSLRQIAIPGQLNGQLTEESPTLPDDSHYEDIVIQGVPNTTVTIGLFSSDFDTYMEIGKVTERYFESLDSNDDCGEEDTNSCITFTFADNGVYVIRANSFGSGETGSFRLTVTPLK
jgi:hypothetical protein